MAALLIFGFLIGMRHALEADHVAAVAALAASRKGFADAVRQGVAWGVGHTVTLFAVGSLAVMLGSAIPERLAAFLELAVGVMLVALGADVIRRLIRDRVHIHRHVHQDGRTHIHAHSHRDEPRRAHHPARHRHSHPAAGLPVRALAVGLMHGMAGSAALIVLASANFARSTNVGLGLAYMALFGVGSILGMAVLSAAIALPLRAAARSVSWLHQALHVLVGAATLTIGVLTVVASAAVL